jgi:urea carboxylase
MKMEIAVQAPVAGRMAEMRATPGRTLRAGDLLAVMEAD